MTNKSYVQEIDALRAIAAILVIVSHWTPELQAGIHLGEIGVQIFFVISGYLITGILLDGRQRIEASASSTGSELKTFYIRRILRIFPLYYAVLFAGAIVGLDAILDHFLYHALYLTNVRVALEGDWIGAAGHFWSLAIEEQFYLLWPLLILSVPRRSLPYLMIGMIIGSIAFRMFVPGENSLTWQTLLPANLDGLGLGALLVYLHRKGGAGWLSPILLVLAATALLFGEWGHIADIEPPRPNILMVKLSAALVGMAAIHFTVLGQGSGVLAPLRLPLLLFLGRISYGLYVYHPFVEHGFVSQGWRIGIFQVSDAARLAVMTVSLLLVCTASWFMLEKPLIGLKRYFPYRRHDQPVRDDRPVAVL